MRHRIVLVIVGIAVVVGVTLLLHRYETHDLTLPKDEVFPKSAGESIASAEVSELPAPRHGVFPSIAELEDSPQGFWKTQECNDFFGWDDTDEEYDFETYREENRARMARWIAILEPSSDPDHQLMVALVTSKDSPEESRERILRLVNAESPHPLAVSFALDACARDDAYCDVLHRFLSDEFGEARRNAESWIDVAGYWLNQGNEAQAIDALDHALAAPVYDSHFIDYAQVFDRGLAASSQMSGIERLVAAIGLAAAGPLGLGIYDTCKDRIESSLLLRRSCAALAARQAAESDNILGQEIGASLQKIIFELDGEPENAQAIEALKAERRATRNSRMVTNNAVTKFRDEALFRSMADHWAVFGEAQAQDFMHAEVLRKVESGEYPPLPECEWPYP
ncbi:MAG: hypothetical protein AAF351_14620 [Pseudomonadota bacterium]